MIYIDTHTHVYVYTDILLFVYVHALSLLSYFFNIFSGV